MTTADERAADTIGKAIDRKVLALRRERTALAVAATRILEIDAELAVLETEQELILPRRPNLTVFIGDSITAAWDLLPLTTAVNKGVPGDSPAQMLARIQTDVLDLEPSNVHILGGANGIVNDTPNAAPIIDFAIAARIAGIKVYVGTVTPGSDRPQAGVEHFNNQLRSAAQLAEFTIIDYYPAMRAGGVYFDQTLYIDTVHPNAVGYARMAGAFRNTFRQSA